jgi:serine phosphatase RsbU (regulator of sigma subunit)
MAILIILEGPEAGRQFPLDGGSSIIGRDPSAQVCLSSQAVSRQHARLECSDNVYFIHDLGSRNGMHLNGKRVKEPMALTEGDRLAIGPYVLGLVVEVANQVIREEVKVDSAGRDLYAKDPAHQLQVVLKITQHLGRTLELDPLLGKLLDYLLVLFPQADRGLVLLCEQDHLVLRARRSRQGAGDLAYLFSRTVVQHALRQGVGVCSDDIHADGRFSGSETVGALKSHALMCVPLIGHDQRRLGVIQMDCAMPGAVFRGEDLRILTAIGLQVAVVLENVTLHAQQLREARQRQEWAVAREIQQGFLPANFTPVEGGEYDLFACVYPARDVSGDLYDFFPLADGRLAFFLGDVSDKGIPAALFMVAVRAFGRHLAAASNSPADTLRRLDVALAANNPSAVFVTLVHGLYDPSTGKALLASGGHPPPLLRRADGQVKPIAIQAGRLLGYGEGDLGLVDAPLTLGLGETLILYSDGVTKAFAPDGRTPFGVDRLREALSGPRAPLSLEACASCVRSDVERFTGSSDLLDDLTLFLLRRK